MPNDLVSSLLSVQQALESKRAKLKRELDELEQLLAGIKRQLQKEQPSEPLFGTLESQDRPFANMSMRWAILFYLNEHMVGGVGTSAIADALKSGGVNSNKPNFNSIVSAVLSQMLAKGELVKADDGFRTSPTGKSVWESVKLSEKFRNRHSLAANAELDDTSID